MKKEIVNNAEGEIDFIKKFAEKDFDNQIPDSVFEKFSGENVKETLIKLHKFIKTIEHAEPKDRSVINIRTPRRIFFEINREASLDELLLIASCILKKLKLKFSYCMVAFSERKNYQHAYLKVYEKGIKDPYVFDVLMDEPFVTVQKITKSKIIKP